MYEYKARLLRVVDGDTVDVDIDLGFKVHIQQRVRLYGIDAPEVRTRDLEEKEKGIASTVYLKQILPREFIVKTYLNKRGKFGRILGTILVNEIDINKQMIEEGHAEKYPAE